jgi:hypothetical protein
VIKFTAKVADILSGQQQITADKRKSQISQIAFDNFLYPRNVDQNAASLEHLDGVRILVNGWRASERLQPKINRRYF